VSQFLYSWIHPDIGLWLAKSSSSKSRDYTSQKDYSEKDGLKDEAIKKISEGYDFVIMGHRHRPLFQKEGQGVYVNLGDWMKTFSYGVFSDGIFYFKKYYDLKSHKIIDELIADSKA
jgi:UDP-2,3-diacylglucosamine hydrolase